MGLRAKDQYETDALVRRFDVRARARADAAAGRPPADARDLTEAEREIAAAVAPERSRIAQARATAQAQAERSLRAAAPAPADIAGPIAEARLALRQTEGRVAHDHAAAARRAREAAADLEGFKRANGLRRAAHYPDSRLLQAGLLLAAAVFESLFSAALFAETDARGLLGGAVTAIGLSGANVTLGFLAGFLGLRYMQHLQPLPKIAGGAAFALLAGLAAFLNFFAALWRQQLSTGAPAADLGDSNVWARIAGFFGDIFTLQEPQAIVLLMLGGGVWVFATLKGYSGFDDPYPDYGKMARAAHGAADELSAMRAEARDELEAPIEAAKAQLSARLEAMRAAMTAMEAAYDEAAAAIGKLDADAARIEAAAQGAIALYRSENAAVRTAPAPRYFAEPPLLAPPEDALRGCGALIAEARAALTAAQTQSAAGLEALLSELEAAQARLDRPEPA